MAVLKWDQTGERTYETGVSKGVLYPQASDGSYPKGVAWNGLTGVTESPSGAEETKLYANNNKYLSLRSAEEVGGTIEAYMYPDEWAACDGTANLGGVDGVHIGQQSRKPFGLSYQNIVGNDTEGEDYGYKIHLVYGGSVSPSEKAYATVNDSPEAITFSWELATTPVPITDHPELKPTSCITIDSTRFTSTEAKAKLDTFKEILYGSTTEDPRLPLPAEVISLLDLNAES